MFHTIGGFGGGPAVSFRLHFLTVGGGSGLRRVDAAWSRPPPSAAGTRETAAGWRAKAEVLKAAIDADVLSLDPEHRLALSLAGDLMAGIKAQR